MNEYVARVKWEAVEVTTGAQEEGELLCHLDDVKITPISVTKGSLLVSAKMRVLGIIKMRLKAVREQIFREISDSEDANEVVGAWYRKSIQLSPRYKFDYAEHPEQHPIQGFGLLGGITDSNEMTFSWDWFNVVNPVTARKLQEEGQINFAVRLTTCGTELVHMVFESDVSLRIMKFATACSLQPDWRITIKQGSEVFWPSLVDGKNVSNGYVAGL